MNSTPLRAHGGEHPVLGVTVQREERNRIGLEAFGQEVIHSRRVLAWIGESLTTRTSRLQIVLPFEEEADTGVFGDADRQAWDPSRNKEN